MITASLVYDGSTVTLPSALLPTGGMSVVKEKNQFVGTELEKLAEVAGRVCYDSFGIGRPSTDFHKHILGVGHLSVLEHCNVTIKISSFDILCSLTHFVNRPGVWVTRTPECFKVTLNLRTLLDWDNWGLFQNDKLFGAYLRNLVQPLAPQILTGVEDVGALVAPFELVTPTTPEESWVTLFLTCSRGCSHELVRHGDFTAFSQRSTRYVDESEGDWVPHPLISSINTHVVNTCRNAYTECVAELEKVHGRKQARGAARGYLGNALKTEIVMSANCRQWKHIIAMRKNEAADKEISVLMEKAEEVLANSKYGQWF